MTFYKANVADVLRLVQRDEGFLRDTEENLQAFFKLIGPQYYPRLFKNVPLFANIWYYSMTSLGNLQTLGEEYTGTIRLCNNRVPSKWMQVTWLLLYIGGEPLLDRLLCYVKKNLLKSPALTNEAKSVLLKCINFFLEEKSYFKSVHNALFYINGSYYNISNRVIGIHYILLRQWQQHDSFTSSFKILGHFSLFYIFFKFASIFISKHTSKSYSRNQTFSHTSKVECILCGELMNLPSATPCGHIFCWECICGSLKYQKICPICREHINPSRIVLLQNYI